MSGITDGKKLDPAVKTAAKEAADGVAKKLGNMLKPGQAPAPKTTQAATPPAAPPKPGQAPARPAPGAPKPPAGGKAPMPAGAKPPAPPVGQFADVPPNASFAGAVRWAVEKGIANGTAEDAFSPHAACTRAQAITFLWRAKGSPEPKGAKLPFADVGADSPYYKAIAWAFENGVATGDENASFLPDDSCTKGQLVTFLWRAQAKPAAQGESAVAAGLPAGYYTDAVAWADTAGVLGKDQARFDPEKPGTRADVVSYLFRTLEK